MIKEQLYRALFGFMQGTVIGIGLVVWFRAIVPWLINTHQDTYLWAAIVGSLICIFACAAVLIEFIAGFFQNNNNSQPKKED